MPYRKPRAWLLPPDLPQLDFNDPIDTALGGWWPLDRSFNGTTPNISAKGNAGTLSGGWSLKRGIIGNAFQGNATDAYLDTGVSINNFPTAMSFSFWMSPTSSDLNGSTPVSSNNFANAGRSVIFYPTNTHIGVEYTITGTDFNTWDTGYVVTAGIWTHVVVVYTAANITLYVNGKSAAVLTAANVAPVAGATIRVGRWNSGDPRWWGGQVDDVRFWSVPLLASAAARLYADRSGGLGLVKPRGRRITSPTSTAPAAVPFLVNWS